MTKRKKKILIWIGAGIPALLLILIIASVLVIRTAWFANFVRDKIISATEESTGAVVEIGAFQFDWRHLTARIRNFVLHGTEPKNADPLASIALIELRLKLFTGLKHAVDLQYLGVDQPRLNLIVFPNGNTNIPQPRVQEQPSQTSGLETVVDLAIGKFQITNGLIESSEQKINFSARGENLRALLNYNPASPSYQGNLWIDPLLLASANNPPLNVHVNVPIALEKDAIRIAGATLKTNLSQIVVNGSVQNMNAPQILAQVNARVSLPEMQRSFALPIDSNAKGVPNLLNLELAAKMDQRSNTLQVRTARVALGETTFQASGTVDPSKNSSVQFNARFVVGELARLMKISTVQPAGDLLANGSAKMDAQNNYVINGTLNSRDLSLRSGTTLLSDVNLYSPFHVDPYLVSIDGLKLNAFGGSLAAKVFLEKMERLRVEGNLQNLSLPVLARSLTGKYLGYDGTLDGSIKGRGDLNAKGTTGYSAHADLTIVPGHRGVPVNGRLYADYIGATDTLKVDNSYLVLPNSRIDLTGALNKRIDINAVSHSLNDFLPAANFASAKGESSLPVSLQSGGVANVQAQITGDVSAPHITSHVSMDRFAIEQRSFDQFAVDLDALPSGAAVQNGILTRNALQTTFNGSIGLHKWSPLPSSQVAANLSMRNGDIADLLSLAGEGGIPATGKLTADVHINGTYGNPLGGATLEVLNGSAYEQPIDRLYAAVNLSDQVITLPTLELAGAGARINAHGTFQHPPDSFTVGRAQFHIATSNVQLGNFQALTRRSPGVAGAIQLNADAAADVREVNEQSEVMISNINADLSARGLRVQNQSAGDLTASARTVNGAVNYNLASDFAGSNIRVTGRTSLARNYPTTADASIHNLSVEKALRIAGQGSIPATGNLSADAHLGGTVQTPNADLSFTLTSAKVYQEAIDRFQGSVQYSNTLANIRSLSLDVPAGSIALTGSFSHPPNDFNAGTLHLNVKSTDIDVAKIQHVQRAQRGIGGTLRLAADLSANLRERHGKPTVLLSNLNADASANAMRLNNLDFGEAILTAHTRGSALNFQLDSKVAQGQIHLSGNSQLTGDYPVRANLAFSNIKYSNLAPFISSEPTVNPAFEALLEGQATLNGPVLNTDALEGRLEVSTLQAQTTPQHSPTGGPPRGKAVTIRNNGPIVLALSRSVVKIQQLRIEGPGTNIEASGSANLKNTRMEGKLNAVADLAFLQDVDSDFYSSGSVAMNATVRGTFSQPVVNGQMQLKNANVNYASAPNGISNANGVIMLNGTSALIRNLTGESGGGKVTLGGFVGYQNSTLTFNLRANATKVRVRYSGISATSNASLTLTGNATRSLLSGTVTVQRIAYGSQGDIGSILSGASTPASTPAAPSPLLSGMRLDVQIVTAPDLRVITTYAESLSVTASLTLRGTADIPGMLGYVNVNDGQLVFFGNSYRVNTGTINFYNPTAIQPVLNVSLETIVQNVDVTLNVSGPINNLHLTYTSDPPLTFQEIVALLATNTTPNDPMIASQQPSPPQQSATQMGESALLGQAVANPVASRVQRVFGLTQFKIDPSFQGNGGGQPHARVTLQQKIANNLTFTYITDVTQTNNQIIRIEWAFTPKLSAVALRDYNGNVSLEFFYRFNKR